MPLRRPRRLLALFALALAVCAAVPCSSLADDDACCGSAAGCGEASVAPCAQLTATPCCDAPQIPLDLPFAPSVPAGLAAVFDDPHSMIVDYTPRPRDPRALTRDSLSIRTIVLRL
jgi:hypothetical protein